MGKQFEQHLSRRIMTDEGWTFFCRICGQFKSETEFYKSNKTKWGIDTKCKLHYTRREPDDDGEMDYLKLNPIKENDFVEAQKMLERLGYRFDTEESVHDQFMRRHNLK